MRKLIIAAMALICSGTSALALDNEPEEGLTHRVYVGMSVSNIRHTWGDPKVGHTLGYIGEFVLPGCAGTFVNFGFDYSMLGDKQPGYVINIPNPLDPDNPTIEEYDPQKLRLHYFSIPLHVGYRYNVIDDLGLYADFGPYFGLGIAGKYSETKVNYFKHSQGDSNRFDCGLGFRVGAEYNDHLSLTFGFNWGLTKHYDVVNGKDPKNFFSTITLGYRF